MPRLAALVEDEARELPELARLHLGRIERLSDEIDRLMGKVRAVSAASDTARLLRTMPGVGPICAMAIEAFVPDLASFARGRDVRRLLIIGAMSRIASARRHPRPVEPWLADKLERKPRMVAAIAEPPRWRGSSGPG